MVIAKHDDGFASTVRLGFQLFSTLRISLERRDLQWFGLNALAEAWGLLSDARARAKQNNLTVVATRFIVKRVQFYVRCLFDGDLRSCIRLDGRQDDERYSCSVLSSTESTKWREEKRESIAPVSIIHYIVQHHDFKGG